MITNKTRKIVFERDRGKCIICSRPDMLERTPHHCFFKSSYFGKDRDESWNLVIICMFCHRCVHQASTDEDIQKGKKIAKKCQEIAIGRYKGENLDKLLEIMRAKYKNSWRYRR